MKNKILEVLDAYTWGVGLALIVVGATKIWTDPTGIFITGAIFIGIGAFIKGIK